jgi:hypothetical protein
MIGFMDVIHVAEKRLFVQAIIPPLEVGPHAETMLNQMLDSSAAPTL